MEELIERIIKWVDELLATQKLVSKGDLDNLDYWKDKRQSGKGYLGGEKLNRRQLQLWEEILLKKFGTKLIIVKDKKLLRILEENGAQAAFDAKTNSILLRRGCTEYEIFHEMKHAEEMNILGTEKYLDGKFGTPSEKLIRKYLRERYVYYEIMRNKSMFNDAQLLDAEQIISEIVRDMKKSGLNPNDF